MGMSPCLVRYQELERWDVKYFSGRLISQYPLASLSNFIIEHNEKVQPYKHPEKTFKILGVNNTDGIFHAYDALGKKIKQPYKKVYAGDFAYNPYRINVGSIGQVPPEHDGAYISPAYVVFSIDKNVVLPELFWFILKSNFFNTTLRAATAGSVRMNLTYTLLGSLKIPLPPMDAQEIIVKNLKSAQSKFKKDTDSSYKLSLSIPQLLSLEIGLPPLTDPHSKQAFSISWKNIDRWGAEVAREIRRKPDLTKSPFPIVALSDVIADLQNGWSPKCLTRQAEKDEWGVLKVGAVSFGWFDENQNKALPANLKPREKYEVISGDLIISRANITQYVGASALVDKVRPRLLLCDKLFRVVWKEKSLIIPQFLNEVFKTPHLRWQIENNLTGASPTMKNISKPALMSLNFPLPPVEIQKHILSEIEEKRRESKLLKDNATERFAHSIIEIEQMILGTRPVEVN